MFKERAKEKCLRDTSHVLHIIPVLKKIHKDSQSVNPSRRGIAQLQLMTNRSHTWAFHWHQHGWP